MTQKTPKKLPDGGYLFPDGITVSAEKINRSLIGISRNNIALLERASGKDIYLLQAEIIHEQALKEEEEKEQMRRLAEERARRLYEREVNGGKHIVKDGHALIIKGGAVLETAPEFTDEEYRIIYFSSFNIRGCYQDKVNIPAYEVRLPDKYPEYRVFVLWHKDI